ncbi:uncharacterized protein LOC115696450 [Cannabis sativa]|uniref:uncharacterized protein LOC115696450 n=1 Tax=Cannabis sativa TaxID=3483 RepID=UPI0011DFDFB0|nr:uncharacterized protein LOC115696450 [Cannabis sativa]
MTANQRCATPIAQGDPNTPPILRSGSVVRNQENSFKNSEQGTKAKVKIISEDIEDEVEFWRPSLVCYVLGANRPLSVIDGFIRRFWKGEVDRVGMITYGVFLVRFNSVQTRDRILNDGYVFFNKRLVIMKAWDPDTNFRKEDITSIPILIQVKDLELKYLVEKSLFKIVGQLGNLLQVDTTIKERNKLTFPRMLIEVSVHQEFPDAIFFEDEYGGNVKVPLMYECKPLICGHCKGMGHETDECRKKASTNQQWVVEEKNKEVSKPEANRGPVVDAGGFQKVSKSTKERGKEVVSAVRTIMLSNPYL